MVTVKRMSKNVVGVQSKKLEITNKTTTNNEAQNHEQNEKQESRTGTMNQDRKQEQWARP